MSLATSVRVCFAFAGLAGGDGRNVATCAVLSPALSAVVSKFAHIAQISEYLKQMVQYLRASSP